MLCEVVYRYHKTIRRVDLTMGKLSTFIQSNNTTIQTYATESATAIDKARLFLLQEFLGAVQSLNSILGEYDILDIDILEIDAKTSGNQYTTTYDKDRAAVYKLQKQVQQKLLNKEAERLKNQLLQLKTQLEVNNV